MDAPLLRPMPRRAFPPFPLYFEFPSAFKPHALCWRRTIQAQVLANRSPMALKHEFEPLPTDAVLLRNYLKRLEESGTISASKAKAWAQEMANEVEVAAIRKKAEEGDAEAMIKLRGVRALRACTFHREVQSNVLFKTPTPQPYPAEHPQAGRMPSATLIRQRLRSSYAHALRQLEMERHEFDSLNALRRASRTLNREATTPLALHAVFSPKKPIKKKQGLEAAERDNQLSLMAAKIKKKQGLEAAERDNQLSLMAAKQARIKVMKENDKLQRIEEAASRRALMVRHQGEHLMSTMESEAVADIYESRAVDSTREASLLTAAMLGEEVDEEEAEDEEEEESEEGSCDAESGGGAEEGAEATLAAGGSDDGDVATIREKRGDEEEAEPAELAEPSPAMPAAAPANAVALAGQEMAQLRAQLLEQEEAHLKLKLDHNELQQQQALEREAAQTNAADLQRELEKAALDIASLKAKLADDAEHRPEAAQCQAETLRAESERQQAVAEKLREELKAALAEAEAATADANDKARQLAAEQKSKLELRDECTRLVNVERDRRLKLTGPPRSSSPDAAQAQALTQALAQLGKKDEKYKKMVALGVAQVTRLSNERDRLRADCEQAQRQRDEAERQRDELKKQTASVGLGVNRAQTLTDQENQS